MTTREPDLGHLPPDLPAPDDDGAARHLPGLSLPDIALPATTGAALSLARLSRRAVVYLYPMTSVPGVALPDNWDAIPGARGCTVESLGFRDHRAALNAHGVDVFGLSTQGTAYQSEMAARLHLPFPVLSDADFALTRALRLPTMEVEGTTLLKRLTLVVEAGTIAHVFYPVFPPGAAAETVLAWLAGPGGRATPVVA